MTDLSDLDIIASNPIKDGLDRFSRLFRSTCKDLGISELQDASKKVILLIEAANTDIKSLILDLVLALLVLPAARSLRSHNNRRTLNSDLAAFYSQLVQTDVNIELIILLLEQVIKPASDLDIWNVVFALVAKPRATPPTILDKSTLDTLLKSTLGSQQGSEQFHNDIDLRILKEVNGCVYNNTKGFYKKFFEWKTWLPAVEQIV